MTHITGQDTAYWNERFALDDWSVNGGNFQSLLFMNTILDVAFGSNAGPHLRAHALIEQADGDAFTYCPTTIIDFGCAEGDGTAVIQSRFPMARVIGMDWSTEAVFKATNRWPTLKFQWGDIENPMDKADIIITSHTLEHVTDPAKTINRLLDFCSWLIVGVPPVSKEEVGGHDGAIPYHEWRAKTTPVYEAARNTVRVVGGEPWVEGTGILIYQGRLTPEVH